MANESEGYSGPERRVSPGDAAVQTFNAVESGLSKAWHIGSMLASLVFSVVILTTQWVAFKDMRRQLDALQQSDAARTKKETADDKARALAAQAEAYYKERMEARQTRDEQFRHTIRAYEFAVMGALREVQGRLNIKPIPLPEIKGDD